MKYLLTAILLLTGGVTGFALADFEVAKSYAKDAIAQARKLPDTAAGCYALAILVAIGFVVLVALMSGCRDAVLAAPMLPVSADVVCDGLWYEATGTITLPRSNDDHIYFRSAFTGQAEAPKMPCDVTYRR